jgi:prolyl-tRNA synthetase
VKFKDAELVGIPYRITVGKRAVKEGVAEVTERASGKTEEYPLESVVEHLLKLVRR